MRTRLRGFCLTALLLLFGQSLSAHDFVVNGIYYTYLTDKTVSVPYDGDYSNEYSGNVVIPSSVTYNGTTYSVTSIGKSAFAGCSGLKSITIPSSVTDVGESAFSYCTVLTSVVIGNSVKSIGQSAFRECTSLKSVEIGNHVTSIGESAFYGCKRLTSIEIPNSVTSIGSSAFHNCI